MILETAVGRTQQVTAIEGSKLSIHAGFETVKSGQLQFLG